MHREIKFRAWDKKHKIMWPFADIDSEHGIVSNAYSLDSKSFEFLEGSLDPEDDLVALQYTGMKDKNGKDIYDGDVVKVERLIALQEVIFILPRITIRSLPDNDDWSDIWEESPSELEVIGNIYEDPELLRRDR